MSWQVQRWDGTNWVDMDVSDLQIKKALDELDSASVTVPLSTTVNRGEKVRILYDGTVVFEGVVQKITRRTDHKVVQLLELAAELRKSIVDYNGTYKHQWTDLCTDDVIDRILENSNWVRGSTADTETTEVIGSGGSSSYSGTLRPVVRQHTVQFSYVVGGLTHQAYDKEGSITSDWFDHYDVDSSDWYNIIGSHWTWNTAESRLEYSGTTREWVVFHRKKFTGGTFEFRVCALGDSAGGGVLLGYQDTKNYYVVEYQFASGEPAWGAVVVYKWVDGSSENLGGYTFETSLGAWHTIRVEWDPSTGSIDVYLDGSNIISTSDTTYTSGYSGFEACDSDLAFDYLDVDDAITCSGTIDYLSGEYSFTLNQSTDSGTDVTCHYVYNPKIRSITIEHTDRLSALSKVVKDMLGWHLWFSNDRKVYFGTVRDDRTDKVITYSDYEEEEDDTETYDKIVVIGGGSNQKITVERGTGQSVGIFEYPDVTDRKELEHIADVLYERYKKGVKRINVTMPLWTEVNPADLVSMNGSTYIVYNIEHDTTTTRLTLGDYFPSFGRIIRSMRRKQEQSDRTSQGTVETVEVPLTYQHVGASSPAKWRISLGDDEYTKCTLHVVLRKWRKLMSTGSKTTGITIDTGYASIDYATTKAIVQPGKADISTDKTYATIQGGGITNTVDDDYQVDTWYTLPYDNSISFTTSEDGYQFTIAVATITVRNEGTGSLRANAQLYWYDGANWVLKCQNWTTIREGCLQSLALMGVANGSDESSVTWRLVVDNVVGEGSCVVRIWNFAINLHGHTLNEGSGHTHSDAGHDHLLNEGEGHKHDDSGHGHGIKDLGHTHPETDDATELDVYPSNVYVYVNGQQVYGPVSGGTETSFDVDITDYLTPGENVIEIRSDTAGGVDGTLYLEKTVRR